MSIVADIQKEVQNAMRAGERLRLDALRMLLSALKQKEIDSGDTLDAAGFAAVVQKLIKQRRDSVEQYNSAGRTELAEKESAEITILQTFLPEAPSAAALEKAVVDAIAACQATAPRDMGKVMAKIKESMPAADMSAVSQLVKQKLLGESNPK